MKGERVSSHHIFQRGHFKISPLEGREIYRELWSEISSRERLYRNSRPKMGEWKKRAWDWIKALTLRQMVSEGMHLGLHSGLMPEDPRNQSPMRNYLPRHQRAAPHFRTNAILYVNSRGQMVDIKKKKIMARLTADGHSWEITTFFPERKKKGLTKSREMIKSAGQTTGHGAVKGYVNSSVPLNFCNA